MNQEIKQKWVAALRSGEYKQGDSHLRQKTFDNQLLDCCLGVLCDLYRKETSLGQWVEKESYGDIDFQASPGEKGENEVLPQQVYEWAGLSNSNPAIKVLEEDGIMRPKDLAWINDMGHSFDKIAKLIDEQL